MRGTRIAIQQCSTLFQYVSIIECRVRVSLGHGVSFVGIKRTSAAVCVVYRHVRRRGRKKNRKRATDYHIILPTVKFENDRCEIEELAEFIFKVQAFFFFSLVLSRSIRRSFYSQRPSGQAVVIGVVPFPFPDS